MMYRLDDLRLCRAKELNPGEIAQIIELGSQIYVTASINSETLAFALDQSNQADWVKVENIEGLAVVYVDTEVEFDPNSLAYSEPKLGDLVVQGSAASLFASFGYGNHAEVPIMAGLKGPNIPRFCFPQWRIVKRTDEGKAVIFERTS